MGHGDSPERGPSPESRPGPVLPPGAVRAGQRDRQIFPNINLETGKKMGDFSTCISSHSWHMGNFFFFNLAVSKVTNRMCFNLQSWGAPEPRCWSCPSPAVRTGPAAAAVGQRAQRDTEAKMTLIRS